MIVPPCPENANVLGGAPAENDWVEDGDALVLEAKKRADDIIGIDDNGAPFDNSEDGQAGFRLPKLDDMEGKKNFSNRNSIFLA